MDHQSSGCQAMTPCVHNRWGNNPYSVQSHDPEVTQLELSQTWIISLIYKLELQNVHGRQSCLHLILSKTVFNSWTFSYQDHKNILSCHLINHVLKAVMLIWWALYYSMKIILPQGTENSQLQTWDAYICHSSLYDFNVPYVSVPKVSSFL